MAQPAAMDLFSFRIRPDLANPIVSGVAPAFPREADLDSAIDYKTHYYANRRAFFIVFALFAPVDIVDSLLKGIPHFLDLGPQYIIINLLYFAGLLTAAITRNERYHRFYAVFFFVQTIVNSFLLFQTLM